MWIWANLGLETAKDHVVLIACESCNVLWLFSSEENGFLWKGLAVGWVHCSLTTRRCHQFVFCNSRTRGSLQVLQIPKLCPFSSGNGALHSLTLIYLYRIVFCYFPPSNHQTGLHALLLTWYPASMAQLGILF